MRRATLALACAIAFNAHAETNSEKYRGLIEDNQARLRFTDAQNMKLLREFRASPVYARVREELKSFYAGPTPRQTIAIDEGREIRWIDRGLGQTAEVLLVDKGGATTSLYSTFSQQMGNAAVITNLQLAPDGKTLVIIIARYGSIDQQEGLVVSLETRREVTRLPIYFDNLTWISPTQFLYARMADDGASVYAQYDVTTNRSSEVQLTGQSQTRDLTLVRELGGKNRSLLTEKKTGVRRAIATGLGRLVGNDRTRAFFLKDGQILQYVEWQKENDAPKVLARDTKMNMSSAWIDEDGVFVQARGPKGRELRVLQPSTGHSIATAAVPDCCSIRAVKWKEAPRTLIVTLTSAAQPQADFVYDLNAWPSDLGARMQTLDGVAFHSEIVDVKSADGTLIPTLLTYRADLRRDGLRPALIKAYGGFNIPGYFDPSFDRPIAEFIKRGGMFVGPAVRGGGEFGSAWHEAAMFERKMRTFEDVDAVARHLVADGWTTARKIALQGTSNGGLTTAATALLFPQDFGLAIPIAGVLDLFGKDRMDALNEGWSDEYGDSTKPYLGKWSPLELAARQKDVRFLIVDGSADTRVNPAHSVKFAKALLDQGGAPDRVSLLTVANGGHHTQSPGKNGSIGLTVQSAIWTMIYEQMFDGGF